VELRTVKSSMVKRFGTLMVVVNLTVAFFSLTDMYLLASGAIRVDYPQDDGFQTSFDPANLELVFKSEYRITNNGFYDLENMNIHAELLTHEGKLLIKYKSTGLRVPKFSTRTFPIEARLPLQRAMGMDMREILFNGSNFVLNVRIEAAYVMGLVHFHLDQVKDYPWEAPLPQFKAMFDNGSLVSTVLDLLGGNLTGIARQVETAIVQAFLAKGTEAKVQLNDWSGFSLTVCGEDLQVRIYLDYPVPATVMEYDISLAGLMLGGGSP